jgi:hypothetical protein
MLVILSCVSIFFSLVNHIVYLVSQYDFDFFVVVETGSRYVFQYFFFFIETGSHYVAQAGLKLLYSSSFSCLVSQLSETRVARHHSQWKPLFFFFFLVVLTASNSIGKHLSHTPSPFLLFVLVCLCPSQSQTNIPTSAST